MMHPALSTSLSRSFGLNSPFSLSALSSSLTALSSSPGFNSMSMSLGRSFEERPKLEAQFFRNFSCCGLDLQDLHGLLEHFEECHVVSDASAGSARQGSSSRGTTDDDGDMDMDEDQSQATASAPPSPRQMHGGSSSLSRLAAHASAFDEPESPALPLQHLDPGMELDMEMDDDEEEGSSPGSSSHTSIASQLGVSNGNALAFTTPMSAFDHPLPLSASTSKKFTGAMNLHGLRGSFGGIGNVRSMDPRGQSGGGGYHTPESSAPGTPAAAEELPGSGIDGVYNIPAGASTSSSQGDTVSLAPSLLFPVTPADSPQEGDTLDDDAFPETYDQEEVEDDEDDEDDEDYTREPVQQTTANDQKIRRLTLNLNSMRQGDVDDPPIGMTKDLAPLMASLNLPLSALPTALHPLGSGVQISPSGRPYTPPSEKPFKCSVPGCDKSYKQQNGLKCVVSTRCTECLHK